MLRKLFSKVLVYGVLVFTCVVLFVGILFWNKNNRSLQTLSHQTSSVQTSTNPLFADGVPKHLHCPHRLIGKYVKEISREDVFMIQAIAEEVITNYNPKRNFKKILNRHLIEQLDYHNNSDIEKRGYRGRDDFPLGANRIDWVVQSILDYPEYVFLQKFHIWILVNREQRLKEGKTYQTSINPLFADGVPKHLQCPPELIGKYFKEVSEADLLKIKAIAQEVWENYNPKRSLATINGEIHEATMYYIANADPNKREPHTGENRIDWVIQSLLDFPEHMKSDYDPKVRLDFAALRRRRLTGN